MPFRVLVRAGLFHPIVAGPRLRGPPARLSDRSQYSNMRAGGQSVRGTQFRALPPDSTNSISVARQLASGGLMVPRLEMAISLRMVTPLSVQ